MSAMFERGKAEGYEWGSSSQDSDEIKDVMSGETDIFSLDPVSNRDGDVVAVSPDDPDAMQYQAGFIKGAEEALPEAYQFEDDLFGYHAAIDWAKSAKPAVLKQVLEGALDILAADKEVGNVRGNPFVRREAARRAINDIAMMAKAADGQNRTEASLDPADIRKLTKKFSPLVASIESNSSVAEEWGLTPPRQAAPDGVRERLSVTPQQGREHSCAATIVINCPEVVALCFGDITLPGRGVITHTWVELDGGLILEPGLQAVYRAEDFEGFYQPKLSERYERELAMYILGRSGEVGPFTAEQVLMGVKGYEESTGKLAFPKRS